MENRQGGRNGITEREVHTVIKQEELKGQKETEKKETQTHMSHREKHIARSMYNQRERERDRQTQTHYESEGKLEMGGF
jgi:hypothetical protein